MQCPKPNGESEFINISPQTSPRKQRVVKNAYVDIDSVAVQPGDNYCEWIKITKQQLKEREAAILDVKRREIEHVVNTEVDKQQANTRMNTMNESKFIVIPPDIFNNTLHALYCKIDEWHGVDLSRRKSPITRYRDYFVVGRNWVSQIKTKIFGDLFWIHFFEFIRKTLDDHWLELNVILAIFNGKVNYSNTKAITLINGGTVLHSLQIHKYLIDLHPSLKVKQWIRNEELRGNYKKKAQSIIQMIQNTVKHITVSSDPTVYKQKSRVPILGKPDPVTSVKKEDDITVTTYPSATTYRLVRGPQRRMSERRYSPYVIRNAVSPPSNTNHNTPSNVVPRQNNMTPDITATLIAPGIHHFRF